MGDGLCAQGLTITNTVWLLSECLLSYLSLVRVVLGSLLIFSGLSNACVCVCMGVGGWACVCNVRVCVYICVCMYVLLKVRYPAIIKV